MLKINIKNTLSKQIGPEHGLKEAEFEAFLKKNGHFIEESFQRQDEAGYNFVTLPEERKTVLEIKKYVAGQKKYGWKNIVVLGIGGSSLGTIAVREALISEFSKGPKLYVVDNIDPHYTAELLENLNLSKTLFVVISKSGTTTEPMVLYALVKEKLIKKFKKNYTKHLVFVTDAEKGLLREIGEVEGITMFDIPDKIGGRFSVLTNVGLLPCALAGFDIEKLMKGASEMRKWIKSNPALENPALQLAAIQYLLDKEKNKSMTVLMPYSNALFRMGDWYRQLLAESIGKNLEAGPTPINALGTTDQHSQLQLYSDGPNNKLLIFLRVLKFGKDPKIGKILPGEMGFLNGKKMSEVIDAAYQGTVEALRKNERPNLTIELDKIDAWHIGSLFMLFEFQVSLLGFFYEVNAFDQPGVEESKKITKKLLGG